MAFSIRATSVLFLAIISSNVVNAQVPWKMCYWPDQTSIASTNTYEMTPCFSGDSQCCKPGDACMSNGLCFSADNGMVWWSFIASTTASILYSNCYFRRYTGELAQSRIGIHPNAPSTVTKVSSSPGLIIVLYSLPPATLVTPRLWSNIFTCSWSQARGWKHWCGNSDNVANICNADGSNGEFITWPKGTVPTVVPLPGVTSDAPAPSATAVEKAEFHWRFCKFFFYLIGASPSNNTFRQRLRLQPSSKS